MVAQKTEEESKENKKPLEPIFWIIFVILGMIGICIAEAVYYRIWPDKSPKVAWVKKSLHPYQIAEVQFDQPRQKGLINSGMITYLNYKGEPVTKEFINFSGGRATIENGGLIYIHDDRERYIPNRLEGQIWEKWLKLKSVQKIEFKSLPTDPDSSGSGFFLSGKMPKIPQIDFEVKDTRGITKSYSTYTTHWIGFYEKKIVPWRAK